MRWVEKKEGAAFPVRATDGSAGYDLCAYEDCRIRKGEQALISTGVGWESTEWCFPMVGLIWPRSGLAFKHGLDVRAGVIDMDYKDEIGVLLFNNGDEDYYVKKGDRIAQIVVQPYSLVENDHVASKERVGGFGHTGK